MAIFIGTGHLKTRFVQRVEEILQNENFNYICFLGNLMPCLFSIEFVSRFFNAMTILLEFIVAGVHIYITPSMITSGVTNTSGVFDVQQGAVCALRLPGTSIHRETKVILENWTVSVFYTRDLIFNVLFYVGVFLYSDKASLEAVSLKANIPSPGFHRLKVDQ